MKTWDAFFRDVMPDVVGCPDPIAEHAIKRAAQEFCDSTRVWRIWVTDILTASGTSTYPIGLPANAELVRIERATIDGRDLELTTADQLPVDWKTYSKSLPDCIHTVDRKNITLLPVPSSIRTIKMEISIKPSSDALGVEDHLFDQYVEHIAIGAKARLMKQAGKPYTNINEAMLLDAQFKHANSTIGAIAMRGFSSRRTRSAGRFY